MEEGLTQINPIVYSSGRSMPFHSGLGRHLKAWRSRTPYGKDTDFVFPSFRANGEVPLSPAVFLRDHLRKAAIGAGVQVPEGASVWAA
jgi:hypothetical protein